MLHVSATLEAGSSMIQGGQALKKRLGNQVGEEKGEDRGRRCGHGGGRRDGMRVE